MDGILVVNKEKGYTSRDVVNIVSKIFNTTKVGHTGTLDPIATGVLVLALGKALKVVDNLSCETKEYIATVKLGISTDTLDITGNILEENHSYNIKKEKLEQVLNSFLGKSIQEVPLYSAVKVNGKRLYEYARCNQSVELPKREIEIYDIKLIELDEDSFKFRVSVSKGTYIRSLIRDIGLKLEIPVTMEDLQRTRQGNIGIDSAYTIKDIESGNYKIIPIVDVVNGFEIVEVDNFIKEKIKNGRILENRYKSDKIMFVDSKKCALALYKVYEKDKNRVKPIKVL